MKSRLDELLSPDRLRDKWQEEEQPAPEETSVAPPEPDHPVALVERLEALAGARFPGATAHGLPVLIGRVRELVEQAYKGERGTDDCATAGEQAVDLAPVRKLLDQIEDLVEALDLGRRRR